MIGRGVPGNEGDLVLGATLEAVDDRHGRVETAAVLLQAGLDAAGDVGLGGAG